MSEENKAPATAMAAAMESAGVKAPPPVAGPAYLASIEERLAAKRRAEAESIASGKDAQMAADCAVNVASGRAVKVAAWSLPTIEARAGDTVHTWCRSHYSALVTSASALARGGVITDRGLQHALTGLARQIASLPAAGGTEVVRAYRILLACCVGSVRLTASRRLSAGWVREDSIARAVAAWSAAAYCPVPADVGALIADCEVVAAIAAEAAAAGVLERQRYAGTDGVHWRIRLAGVAVTVAAEDVGGKAAD